MGCGASTAAPPAGASTRAQGEEPYKVVDAPASGEFDYYGYAEERLRRVFAPDDDDAL